VDFDDPACVCVKWPGRAAGLSDHLDYLSASSALLPSRTATHAAAWPDPRAVAAPMPAPAPFSTITTLFSLRLCTAPC